MRKPEQVLSSRVEENLSAEEDLDPLPEDCCSLQYHKRSLESSVVGSLMTAEVEGEASCLQGDIQTKLLAGGEESPHPTEHKETRQTVQV